MSSPHAILHSRSPFGDEYRYTLDEAHETERLNEFVRSNKRRPTVVIQGLGFVGTAMAAATAATVRTLPDGTTEPLYNVLGVDLPTEEHYWKIARVQHGLPPVVSSDASLEAAYRQACTQGNLTATYSPTAYALADVVVVDIHLDIAKQEYGNPEKYAFSFESYTAALRTVAEHVREEVLIIIETTVPPGTTERVVKPLFDEVFQRRGLPTDRLKIAHSYERVMPGKEYLNSITNFYRVYSGINEASKQAAREFLSSFINTNDFPLTELHSTTASEMSKVLENSFRAANIAFIQEWTDFADRAGVNLFEVIQAIRVRPTHRNIMAPGLGVGGYCLTKDSLLADWAYTHLFGADEHLSVSLRAIGINDTMPEYTFARLRQVVPDMQGKHITILGVSYLNDVADTRYSPTELVFKRCREAGAVVRVHDTLVSYWAEQGIHVETRLEAMASFPHDVLIFAVRHSPYLALNADDITRLFPGVMVIVDTMNIISDTTAHQLMERGITMIGIGKGHWR
jgi:nucleotide sugar dehydrogenase